MLVYSSQLQSKKGWIVCLTLLSHVLTLFATSLMQTAGHKMVAFTVRFSSLLNKTIRTRKDRKIAVSVLHAIFVDSTHVSASVQSPLDLCHTVEGRNTCSNPQHPQPKFESCDCKFLQDFQQQTEDSNITNTTPKSNTLSTYYNTFLTKSNHNSIRSSNALSSFTSPLKTHLSKLPS